MTRANLTQKSDYVMAAFWGLLFAAVFPPSPFGWLAWISLAPLFKLVENKECRTAFGLGWTWGVAHFVALIYWIVIAVGHYGKMSFITAIAAVLLLAIYLAIYPALFCSLVVLLKDTKSASVWIPFSWVALEYGRAKLLTGFPWCLTGYSQYNHPLLIQVAAIFGVYGLSFAIILVNWYCYKVFLARNNHSLRQLIQSSLFTFLCVAVILWFGYQQLHPSIIPTQRKETSLRVAIVQPSIDQSLKWDTRFQNKTMELYETLTRAAASSNPDLVIWPETATPFFFQANEPMAKRVVALSQELNCPILFGSPAYEESESNTRYYNRAYLLKPDGSMPQYYDKVHLVPFGEYVPLARVLSFVGKLVPGAGSFSPGSSFRPIEFHGSRFGVMICFEAIFPEISRTEKRQGAEFFVNLTNDAWFGKTSAPYQHLAMTVFRAVENRVPLVRAANTGFSAIIDPYGRIKAKSRLFTKEVLVGKITVSSTHASTFYERYGDLFAKAALLISFSVFIIALVQRKGR
ncbi:MAG: apolipoprotein N-acyltransferase [Deltaproteobacteria bacterium]|nr:apolipoprotein N-acyltransferase [Deltaproteobacteria bacterium]MBW2081508.1 apolipoprotein N-acyltransferase [Deltaproteobacteria bacterium]